MIPSLSNTCRVRDKPIYVSCTYTSKHISPSINMDVSIFFTERIEGVLIDSLIINSYYCIMGIFDKLFNREPKPGLPQPVGDVDFDHRVLDSPLPTAVEFYSTTCPTCHMMTGLLKEVGPEFAGKLEIFTVNVNYNPQLARRMEIRSVPTLILFQGTKPVHRLSGPIPLEPLRALLDKLTKES